MLRLPTYIYFISLFCCVGMQAFAQDSPKEDGVELAEQPRRKIIRIGVDPTRSALSLLQPATRGGVEFAVDTEVLKRLYAVGELGYTFATYEPENLYDYSTQGVFGRVGFDYNFLEPVDANDHDAFFFGLRMAGTRFNQSVTNIVYENVFGKTTVDFPEDHVSAYWSEITVGVKVEAFKNFWIGWTGRGKVMFSTPKAQMDPYIIPGYGRVPDEGRFTADMNIYLLYSISFK